MTSRAACAATTATGLHAFCRRPGDGRRAAGSRPDARRALGRGDPRGQRRRHLRHALHVRHDRPLEGRDAQGVGRGQAARDTATFDRLTENDSVLAYLPLAWVGDHYLNYAQGYVSGFCMNCPESAETVAQDLREIGPTFYFAPPRIFESLLTSVTIRMEDAGWLKRKMFGHFIGVAQQARRGDPRRPAGAACAAGLSYALGDLLVYGPLKNVLGLSKIRVAYTAGEAIGAGPVLVLPLARHQSEAALRPDRSVPLCDRARRTARCAPTRSGRRRPMSTSASPMTARCSSVRPACFPAISSRTRQTAEAMTADGYVKTGDAGFFDTDGQLKIIDRAKDVGRLTIGRAVRAEIHREHAEILSQHQGGGGLRRRPRFLPPPSSTSTCRRSATGPSATTSPMPPIRNSPATRRSTRSSPATSTRPIGGWPASR